jgi:hypothetical protein
MIGGVSLPLTAQTIVTRAARDRITTSGADAVDSDYAMLLDQLGGAPAVVTAMPLIVRGKVVAVLYADSSSTDTNAMNVDALDLLTRVGRWQLIWSRFRSCRAPARRLPRQLRRRARARRASIHRRLKRRNCQSEAIETEPAATG